MLVASHWRAGFGGCLWFLKRNLGIWRGVGDDGSGKFIVVVYLITNGLVHLLVLRIDD